jgi:manganese oxidase
MRTTICAVVLLAFMPGIAGAQAPFPKSTANDNRTHAGALANGVLTLKLNVVRAMFHPDRDDDPGVDLLAIQEEGRAPSIPAPLIRVPVGTEIRTTVRNTLTDSSVLVYGLSGERSANDTVRIQPGKTRDLVATARVPGNYIYQIAWSNRTSRFGGDRMMTGAFVVDEPGSKPNDRVLVLLQWMDSIRLKAYPGAVDEVLTINGKVWPHNERMKYDLGEAITWRVINGSFDTHPMHLHGVHFDVLARGTFARDTSFAPENIRRVFTERMPPLTTMTMRWKPERAGNWLFHCHLNFHIMPHPPLGEMKAAADHGKHALHGMGGLVLGTEIRGTVAKDVEARKSLRLQVDQFDSIPGDFGPPFAYSFTTTPGSTTVAGPPIIVTRNEPIAINVVNRTQVPTSVHWHGLEIESYYDGVGGFGGTPQRVTPDIPPGDSFVVKMTPPRAGTFIYHSHFDEVRQQSGGLSGAFVVTAPDQPWDAARERIILFSTARDTISTPVLINGSRNTVYEMKTGETYRLRLINITLDRPAMFASIVKGSEQLVWRRVAKDAIDTPAHRVIEEPANQRISIGETFDMLFTAPPPGEYTINARTGNGLLIGSARLVVR